MLDLRQGDCLEVMRGMADASVTAIVTDPPYALEFMGKGWDKVLPSDEVWREALRVLKPGGVALVFGGTRTFHRLTCSIEDAGFQVRDCLAWMYGSGFPKSLAIDKAIDRQRDDREEILEVTRWINGAVKVSGATYRQILEAFGFNEGSGQVGHWTAITQGSQPAVPTLEQVPKLLDVLGNPEVPERIGRLLLDLNGKKGQPGPDWFRRAVVGTKTKGSSPLPGNHSGSWQDGQQDGTFDVTAPATSRSAPWQGYGTALKPAWEPIVLAMKPTDGTFAANALAHGVAGINVDECRVDYQNEADMAQAAVPNPVFNSPTGQVYNMKTGKGRNGECFDPSKGRWPANVVHDGSDEVMETFPDAPGQQGDLKNQDHSVPAGNTFGQYGPKKAHEARVDGTKSAARFFYCAKASKKDRGEGNTHPTVKPTELMRWLVRMVKMPAGTVVLDPFMGSGSTGVACAAEGVDFVGIERDADYLEIAKRRID